MKVVFAFSTFLVNAFVLIVIQSVQLVIADGYFIPKWYLDKKVPSRLKMIFKLNLTGLY